MIYGGPRTVVAPDLLLLDSKLSVPRPRPGFVSRAGLIEKARGGGCRVIGVTAPAGYGKSTLLVEWALAEDRPVVWVSFDRLDDDPALVLSLLASACARAWPADAGLIADVSGVGESFRATSPAAAAGVR
jgi:LuxR family transcriptional regulator, maltose regulon positive regulatory protein